MRLREAKKKPREIKSPSRAPRTHCESAAEIPTQSCCGIRLQLSQAASSLFLSCRYGLGGMSRSLGFCWIRMSNTVPSPRAGPLHHVTPVTGLGIFSPLYTSLRSTSLLNRSMPGTRVLFRYLVILGSGPYQEDNTSSWPTKFHIVTLLSDNLPADRIA
ncbi:uncharacterized protein BDW70DRAFT_18690 [Aspergillus foveolatus]|uniref:uncharacterized protein n=1 Tax=Aspergillus foveolatus TaxID=210207 RepID=UPI003CCDE1B6